ncbi:MAG TPA: hypothetical protein VF545_04565 [Thermoleophilaceae bacterium]
MRPATIGALAIALVLAGCGGGDDGTTTTSPARPDPAAIPRESAPPAGGARGLPPEFIECMADQGVEIEQPTDIHSPEAQGALQACLPSLHSGGAGP